VRLFFDDDALVAVLKEVPGSFGAKVIPYRVPSHPPTHDPHERPVARLPHEMEVIGK
jgi:hypothetical protein